MNTLLKITSLLLVVALPTAFAAEAYGITLPTVIDSAHLFAGFVVSLTLLTMFADYAGSRPVGVAHCGKLANVSPKSNLRLAA